MLASEYGYTVQEIGELTLRQIDCLLPKMSDRRSREAKFLADIHGAKFEDKRSKKAEPVDKKKREEAKKLMENFINRKTAEALRKMEDERIRD
jgi:hypothetical protein